MKGIDFFFVTFYSLMEDELHSNRHPKSLLAAAIDKDIPNQDPNPALNPCKVESAYCHLTTGIEHCFVALTCHKLALYLRETGIQSNFQDVIYIPNLRAEKKGGFDLSIGVGVSDLTPRLRTMHKMLDGRRSFNRWCDESWRWSITRKDKKDWNHLNTLLSNYIDNLANNEFRPFLILHVCYCLHDYRRMGKVIDGTRIPDFSEPLRSTVIDISQIVTGLREEIWRDLLNSDDFELQITKDVLNREPDESPGEYLVRIGNLNLFKAFAQGNGHRFQMPILTFQQFLDGQFRPFYTQQVRGKIA